MFYKISVFIIFSVVASSFLILPQAQAYDIYSAANPSKIHYEVPDGVTVSLARRPDLREGYFALVVASNTVTSGCSRMGDLLYRVDFKGTFLDITIYDYDVDVRNVSKNPQYGCDKSYQNPKAEIILSYEDLLEHETRQIRFKMSESLGYYDIDLSKNKIQLISNNDIPKSFQRFSPLKRSGVKDTLTYWFYPENALILYVPNVNQNNEADLGAALDTLAAEHGLTPLDEVIDSFYSQITTPNHYYYVDNNGETASAISSDTYSVIGNIQIKTVTYGLKKDIESLKDVVVYAKKPGRYE